MARLIKKEYVVPFILVTSLFFMWGFFRSILDLLNKHFQTLLDISITKSAYVQGAFFLGYFLLALPAGSFINRFGYRRGVVFGLVLFAIGSLLFIPGGYLLNFNFFLFSLFVIASGLVFLETAANPYVTRLGEKETAASRLNLAQSFNGLGCAIGPFLGGLVLFGNNSGSDASANLSTPYAVMAVVVLVIAFLFSRANLPEIKEEEADSAQAGDPKKLSRNGLFIFGFIALLCYEISEISINSLFINYSESEQQIVPSLATRLLSFCLLMFMGARFVGSWVMSRISAEKVLLFCAIGTVLTTLLVAMRLGKVSMVALVANYALEAIMFPTIFSIALSSVGPLTKRASSVLMLSTIGGAIGTLLMAYMADRVNLSTSFIVPMLGYLVVAIYAFHVARKRVTTTH